MKPIFSNLMAYETTLTLPPNFSELVENEAFDSLGRSAYSGKGFAELTEGRRLIESDGRVLVRFVAQEKHVNQAAVTSILEERKKKIEADGRELAGSDEWKMREQIEQELLPYTMASTLSCYVMFCPFEKRIYLSCNNASTAETVLGFIRLTLGSLPVSPVKFWADASEKFSNYIIKRGDVTPPLPGILKVDIYGALVCSGEKGKKVSTANLCFRDESVETLIRDDELVVRSIDVSLKASEKENAEVEATFKLILPASGDISLKKFDYEMSSSIQLDVSVANEEGDGDLLHQYTVEMLVVGRYARRIYDALASFAGGYLNEEDQPAEESQPEPEESTGDELDPMYERAVGFVTETQKASISGVQRQFRIGYDRASRIIEQMEAQGVISAPGPNGNREVLKELKTA